MIAFPSMRTLRGQPVLLVGAGIVFLLVGGLAFAFINDNGDNQAGEAGVGQASNFSIEAFDGSTFTLADHSDKPVLLYFWASWCEPCKTEAPLIQRLWPEYQAKGYVFVGMNIWDSETDAREFAQDYGLTFPVIRDRENKVYLDYGVERLPMALFLRPGMDIDRRYLGELKESDLRSMLDRLGETP